MQKPRLQVGGGFTGPSDLSGPGDFSGPGEFSPKNYGYDPNLRPQRSGPFQLSPPVESMRLTRGFLPARGNRRAHHGIDIPGPMNAPIHAAHDGVVVYAGQRFRGYGKMVLIEYNDTWATLYAHLNAFRVVTGQEVQAGEVIGLMGRTGHATGVHLHFELLRDKIPVDPMPFFGNFLTSI